MIPGFVKCVLKNLMSYRKYLRDTDRLEVAKIAYRCCLDTIEIHMKEVKQKTDNDETRLQFLVDVFRVYQYGIKATHKPHRVIELFKESYRMYKKDSVSLEHYLLQ